MVALGGSMFIFQNGPYHFGLANGVLDAFMGKDFRGIVARSHQKIPWDDTRNLPESKKHQPFHGGFYDIASSHEA